MILNVDLVYPVGSIYMNYSNPTNPGVLFGGTWVAIPYRFLIGVGALGYNNNNNFGTVDPQVQAGYYMPAGQLCGEIWHALSVNEMPPHNHTFQRGTNGGGYFGVTGKEPDGNPPYTVTTSTAGGGYAHNNMPPFVSVYMWRRTA